MPVESSNLDPALWRNPPVEYRPAPFWVWNETQEPPELVRQIREMKARGFGGFFMHARVGLKTRYLGEEWFEHVRLCTAEAERLGMQAWLYDEDRWPSGYAGGKIAQVEDLDYAAQALACYEQAGERRFVVERAPQTAEFNGAAAVDVLNPEVIAAFLQLTHEQYARVIGDQFGRAVPGSFTDEPSYVPWGHPHLFGTVPWTGRLEEEFAARRGYALRPHLAQLFFDEGDFRKVRLDFYRTVTELFVEAFTRQIYDWCEARGLVSTGHMMMEDNLLHQVRAVGAAMPHYEWMQMPGIDHLGNGVLDSPLLPKQCASVASQLGGRRMLSELWGGSGWETRLADLKPAGDWDLALGVNLVNQHLAYYSIRGRRKRDYPAGCCYQVPGYDLYQAFNDYWARLSYALTRGRAERRVLLLHPQQSAWALYTPLEPGPAEALDARWQELTTQLLQTQRDYDLGDEMILERHARVESGKLVVGEMTYSAVVVPSAETWSATTLHLLQELVAQGGLVVAVEPVAQFLDGQASPELEAFWTDPAIVRVAAPTSAALAAALAVVPQDIQVTDEMGERVPELVYMHRACGERDLYFLTCGRRLESFRAAVSLEGEGRVEQYDPHTGAVTALPSVVSEGRTRFTVELPARGSVLVSLDRTRRPARPPATIRPRVQRLTGRWQVERLDPNALLLDRAALRVGTSPWSEPMGIFGSGSGLAAVPNVEDTITLAYDLYKIWPDWPLALRFEVAASLPQADRVQAWVITEDAQAMDSWQVNGRAAPRLPGKWWLDRQFAAFDASGLLRLGRNRLECAVHWRRPVVPGTMIFTSDGTELDNCYLVGDFSVTRKGTNAFALAPAAQLPADPSADLVAAGLPFYAGRVRYVKTVKLPEVVKGHRHLLRLPRPAGEGLRVLVNGKPVADLWCEPWEAEVTRHLVAGDNRVEVLLYSSIGNLLGLTHHTPPWSDIAHRHDGYALQPLGLGGVPELVW